MFNLIRHYVTGSINTALMVEQLRFTASCWLKADKRQVASARRKTNRFGGISSTYRCFETAILCARKEEHQRTRQNDTEEKWPYKNASITNFSYVFHPVLQLKLLFVHVLIAIKNIKQRRRWKHKDKLFNSPHNKRIILVKV